MLRIIWYISYELISSIIIIFIIIFIIHIIYLSTLCSILIWDSSSKYLTFRML